MGGGACAVIIQGQSLTGAILGIYEVLTYAQTADDINLTPEEKERITVFMGALKTRTDDIINSVRSGSTDDLDIITLGAQIIGNLGALCETAAISPLAEETRKDLAAFLEGERKTAEGFLKTMEKRARDSGY